MPLRRNRGHSAAKLLHASHIRHRYRRQQNARDSGTMLLDVAHTGSGERSRSPAARRHTAMDTIATCPTLGEAAAAAKAGTARYAAHGDNRKRGSSWRRDDRFRYTFAIELRSSCNSARRLLPLGPALGVRLDPLRSLLGKEHDGDGSRQAANKARDGSEQKQSPVPLKPDRSMTAGVPFQ